MKIVTNFHHSFHNFHFQGAVFKLLVLYYMTVSNHKIFSQKTKEKQQILKLEKLEQAVFGFSLEKIQDN